MDTWTVNAEPREEVVRVRWRAMSGAPERDAAREHCWPKPGLREDMDIGAPVDESVQAVRAVPIVVAWGEVDRNGVEARERLAQKLGGVPAGAFMFVEVATTEERVRRLLARQVHDLQQCVSQGLAAPPGRVTRRAGPRKHRVKMEVREVNDSQQSKESRA